MKKSKTDPESGYYHRSNKEKGFMYLDHRTVDGKSNIIIDAHITKGNVHDSVPYIDRMNHIKETYKIKPRCVGVDSGYSTIDIIEYFKKENIYGVIGYRRFGTKESRKNKKEFTYYPEKDVYICEKTGIVLPYRNITREGYKQYYSKNQCEGCPYKNKCCGKSNKKVISRHIKAELREEQNKIRLSDLGKEIYKLRKEKVERSFGDSKQNHGYRYAMHRGLKKVQDYAWLSCSAQNMKNIAIKIDRKPKEGTELAYTIANMIKIVKKTLFFISNKKQTLKT